MLASGANVGDTVDVVAYGTVSVSNTYTQAQANALFVDVAGDTMTGNLSFGDNDKAIFGAGSDLEIYSDGNNGIINEVSGTGSLLLQGSNTRIKTANGSDNMAEFLAGSAVKLYHAGDEKLATTSIGVAVTGNVSATGGIFADTLMQIDNTTGFGKIEVGGASGAFIDLKTPASDDYDGRIYYDGSQLYITAANNQPVQLRHDNSTKLATASTGVDVTGTVDVDLVNATGGITFDPPGTGTDTATDVAIAIPRGNRIVGYNDGYIRTLLDYNTSGTIEIGQNNTSIVSDISLRPGSTGSVILYEGGSTKLETTTTGISVTGNIAVTGTVDGRDIATNIPASLGTAGQVLSVNAGANAAEWADVASGGTSNGFVYFMRG